MKLLLSRKVYYWILIVDASSINCHDHSVEILEVKILQSQCYLSKSTKVNLKYVLCRMAHFTWIWWYLYYNYWCIKCDFSKLHNNYIKMLKCFSHSKFITAEAKLPHINTITSNYSNQINVQYLTFTFSTWNVENVKVGTCENGNTQVEKKCSILPL